MGSLPTNVHLSETQQPQLLGAYITSYALAVIAVSLSRKYLRELGYGWMIIPFVLPWPSLEQSSLICSCVSQRS